MNPSPATINSVTALAAAAGRANWSSIATAVTLLAAASPAPAAPGDFDTSFSGDGAAPADIQSSEAALTLAVQPDQKLIAGGWAYSNAENDFDFALARFN